MRVHTVKKGRKDYKPGHPLKFVRGLKEMSLTACIPCDAWFDPTESGPLGADGKDQNKIAGCSFVYIFAPLAWTKRKNSVLITFRPAIEEGWFEVNGYINDSKGNFTYGQFFLVEGDVDFFCDVDVYRSSGAATFKFNQGERSDKMELNGFNGRGLAVGVGPSFGGNKNSPISHFVKTLFRF